ncbi:MAG: threonylcarbamoyl-AMP synthase [Bacteroidetes bacterium]|nr:threonylcarbamoyl-AMP synthase [Bacteroidota bacterium]
MPPSHQTLCKDDVAEAASLLRRGELVAIPTETVYGLAGLALNEAAVARIFAVKNRPHFDPLIAHLADASWLDRYVRHVPEPALALARRFWPGPLTLVLPRQENIPDLVTSGLDTVAVRVPDHPLTLQLLRELDAPLAAPSANPFGYISPTTPQHVLDQLGGRIAMVLDGGPCRVGLESSIIGFDGDKPLLYRLGGLSREQIEAVAGPVEMSLHQSSDPRAPGQLLNHYAPRTPLLLGDPALLAWEHPGRRLGYLAFQAPPDGPWMTGRVLSASADPEEAARNLFRMLRELDAQPLDYILAERLPDQGLGLAINDRLERAAQR